MTHTLMGFPISVQENMDAQVTVKVPATAGRKAYEYIKKTGGASEGKLKPFKPFKAGFGESALAGGALGLGILAAAKLGGNKEGDEQARYEKFKAEKKAANKKRSEDATKRILALNEEFQAELAKRGSEPKKSKSLELNRRKRSTRRNSLDERIDSFLARITLR